MNYNNNYNYNNNNRINHLQISLEGDRIKFRFNKLII